MSQAQRSPGEAFEVQLAYYDRQIEARTNFGLALRLQPSMGWMTTLTSCCGSEVQSTVGGKFKYICSLCYHSVDAPRRGRLAEDSTDLDEWVEEHLSVLFASTVAEALRDKLTRVSGVIHSSQTSRWGEKDPRAYVTRASGELA